MNFSEYQIQSRKTAKYPGMGSNIIYPVLGLTGEAGEVADKVKKLIRDKNIDNPNNISVEDTEELKKELGDVLWYITQIATELKLDLTDVAQANLEKLFSRMERDQIKGSGDNR